MDIFVKDSVVKETEKSSVDYFQRLSARVTVQKNETDAAAANRETHGDRAWQIEHRATDCDVTSGLATVIHR